MGPTGPVDFDQKALLPWMEAFGVLPGDRIRVMDMVIDSIRKLLPDSEGETPREEEEIAKIMGSMGIK